MSMMNYLAEEYAKVKLTYQKIHKSQFEIMLDKAKEKYKVEKNVDVRSVQRCIRRRFERKSLQCHHRGTESPMAKLEPAILEIALQRGKMNQPLTVKEGLYLSNSLIKPVSKTEAAMISYLKRRGQYSTVGTSTKSTSMLLGTGYWAGFRRRYNHLLVSKKGIQF